MTALEGSSIKTKVPCVLRLYDSLCPSNTTHGTNPTNKLFNAQSFCSVLIVDRYSFRL